VQDDPRLLQWANWKLATIDTKIRNFFVWAAQDGIVGH